MSSGPGEVVANNLVLTAQSYTFRGVVTRGNAGWLEGNTVIAGQIVRQGYYTTKRALGIGFGYGTTGGTAVANQTRGMDVGVGPEAPGEPTPHRVLNHFSWDDALSIDPTGLQP
jgi:hypothetical protein